MAPASVRIEHNERGGPQRVEHFCCATCRRGQPGAKALRVWWMQSFPNWAQTRLSAKCSLQLIVRLSATGLSDGAGGWRSNGTTVREQCRLLSGTLCFSSQLIVPLVDIKMHSEPVLKTAPPVISRSGVASGPDKRQ